MNLKKRVGPNCSCAVNTKNITAKYSLHILENVQKNKKKTLDNLGLEKFLQNVVSGKNTEDEKVTITQVGLCS